MLKRVSLIHIGDIHFPEAKDERLEDWKDSGFPAAVAERTRLRPITCVARTLTRVLEEQPDALLLSGDLTSFGDCDGYRSCLTYLDSLVNLKRWDPTSIHVVPGNHDVERSKVDPSGVDLSSKFTAFDDAWKALGLQVLAFDQVRQSSLRTKKSKTGGALLLSLNSSLGCGEMRYPEPIRAGLVALLDSYASSVPRDKAFEVVGEPLDTPAFDQTHVENVCQSISVLERNIIPLVISHHNILPQAMPRISVYSELINAGILRSRLSHLQRPVIYCHGHIHDHPLEVISEPEFGGSKLICISAPRFSDGFNMIAIEYAGNGEPLGCVITSYRLSRRDGEVRPITLRIPFHGLTYTNVRNLCDPLLPKVLANLSEGDMRFTEIFAQLHLKPSQRQQLANALVEGEWVGALELGDRKEDPMHWIIRKVMR